MNYLGVFFGVTLRFGLVCDASIGPEFLVMCGVLRGRIRHGVGTIWVTW